MTSWPDLHRRFLKFTYLADVPAYADVFDAIEDLLHLGQAHTSALPSAPLNPLRPLPRTYPESTSHLLNFITAHTQNSPPSPTRLAIGLLQHQLWRQTDHLERYERLGPSSLPPSPSPEILLPAPSTLLARKSNPTLPELTDLAYFLITPQSQFPINPELFGEADPSILKFLETYIPKHLTPPTSPLPPPLAAALRECRRRLSLIRNSAAKLRNKSGGKRRLSHFDQTDARLLRLSNPPAPPSRL